MADEIKTGPRKVFEINIPLKTFMFEGQNLPVTFVETTEVADGVHCDIYKFDGDSTKDLGIIRIDPGKKTPLQKVLKGEQTVEGYRSGVGKLIVTEPDNNRQRIYEARKGSFYQRKEDNKIIVEKKNDTSTPDGVTVNTGELMQWQADPNYGLTAYEICFPPYEDGRFENIEE